MMPWGIYPDSVSAEPTGVPFVAALCIDGVPASALLMGKTGCGKTLTAALWALRAMEAGAAVAVVDVRGAHGDEVGFGHSRYVDVRSAAILRGYPTLDHRRLASPGTLGTHGLRLYNGNPCHWRATVGADVPIPAQENYHQAAADQLRSILDQRRQTYDAQASPPLIVIVDHYSTEVQVLEEPLLRLIDAGRALRMGLWFVSEMGYADVSRAPVLARLDTEARVMAIWRQDATDADAMLRDGLLTNQSDGNNQARLSFWQCLIKLNHQVIRFGWVFPRTSEAYQMICS